jgi:hypothetical protein
MDLSTIHHINSNTAMSMVVDIHYTPLCMFILKQLCPVGFVAPDDPLRGGIDWVPGTGCAAECPRPMFTHAEYDAVSNYIIPISYVCSACLFSLLKLVLTPLRRCSTRHASWHIVPGS